MKKNKTLCYCFDLDNVICNTKKKFYKRSKPKKKVIEIINKLFKKKNRILIFTARGMTTYKENLSIIEKKIRPMTENQLKTWGVKYHKLILGKPSYDVYVDDKNFEFKKDWYKKIIK